MLSNNLLLLYIISFFQLRQAIGEKMYKIFINLCNKNNITPTKLAQEIGIKHQLFSYWKSGKRQPSLNTLTKIAEYFNVPIDYLLGNTIPNTIKSAELDADIISDKEFMNLVYQLYMLDNASISCLKENLDLIVDKSVKPRKIKSELVNYFSLTKDQRIIIDNTIRAFTNQNQTEE